MNTNCGDASTPASINCAGPLLQHLVTAAFSIIGVITVILIMYGGFKFITAGGDNKQLDGARKTLTYAFIGLGVVLLSVFIINILAKFTGLTCLTTFGFAGSCQ